MSRYIDADALIRKIQEGHKFGSLTITELISECPTADVREVIPCEECIHAKQHSYAPAECQWYCTISLQYHGGRFFCACGEKATDLLEWIHRGDDDE